MDATTATSDAVKKDDVAVKAEEVKPAASSAAETKATEVEEFPDPDEDDLDDLDDMLEEFSAAKLSEKKTAAPLDHAKPDGSGQPSIASASQAEPRSEDAVTEEDFAKQLQEGMAGLLGEIDKSPDMQQQLESMFKQMAAAAEAEEPGASADAPAKASGSVPEPSATGAADPALDASFQETIRRTMERMQTSGEQATAAASTGGGDDFMAEMLKQMSSGDFNAEGSEEDFSKMLMGMMEQLTNKDILYEPMKELNDKYPAWLEKNSASTSQEDLKRYQEQKAVVGEIVAKFEESTYADSNAADREYIVERMQKMQAAGSPPADLVGDMDSAQDAFNVSDEQCNPQ